MSKLSIITVTRNEASQIRRCLESVYSQTYKNVEHIIVDGESNDGSLSIIESYAVKTAGEVKVFQQRPSGVYNALNFGIREASGNVIGMLHANDAFATNDVLKRVMSEFDQHPDVDIVYGDVHYVDRRGRRVRYYSGRTFEKRKVLSGYCFPHTSMFVRREFFERCGLYNQAYPVAGDFDWIVRALLLHGGKALYVLLDMVSMSVGGLSGKWRSRLWRNPSEKYRILRSHGFAVSPFRLLERYIHLFDK